MPAVAEAPARGLSLADFNAPGMPPDDYVMPPSQGGKPAGDVPRGTVGDNAAPTGNEPEKQDDPPDAPLVDDTKSPEPETDKGAADLSAAMDAQGEAAVKAEQERVVADRKAADEAAAAAKAKADAEKLAPERDADLKDTDPHTPPKTRKMIEGVRALTKAARDERDAVIAEREALKKERDELAEKVKTAPLPKNVEDEVKMLRERIRELDIEKDPALQTKYDSKVAANNATILDTLKAQGFGLVLDAEGKKHVEDPKAIAALTKAGLTFSNLAPYVKKLDEAGLVDEAEAIRDAIRENNRLGRDKAAEIGQWKVGYDQRIQERTAQSKAAQEATANNFRTQTETALKADLDVLAKNFPYINSPAEPLATDAPATVTAKKAAIAEWQAAAKQIETAVAGFDVSKVAPERQAEAVGKINAAAIQSVILKTHVLPRVLKEAAALNARVKELEAELGKIKGAGSLSRRQSAPSDDRGGNNGRAEPRSLEEAFGALMPGNTQG